MLRQAVLIIFVATLLLVAPSLHRPFFSRGEPREALVATGMISTGNWISPPAYDNSVPSKPPFTHWLMAAFSTPLGSVTEVTARLPSALSTLAFLPLFVAFVARRTTPLFALLAGIILLSSPEWFRAATSCRVDTVLATSMAGGMFALFSWNERGRKGIPFLAIILLTIATLTKGPIGFCLPGTIFGLFLLFRGEVKVGQFGRLLGNILVVLTPILLLSAIWYVLGYLERGDEFLQKVWYENFQRLSGTMEDEPHEHGIGYLWGLTFVGLLPWSLALIVIIPTWYRDKRQRDSSQSYSIVRSFRDLSSLQQFSCIAVFCTLALFSLPSSKRSVYILPAYPFIAILLASGIERCGRSLETLFKVVRVVSWTVVLVSILSVPFFLLAALPSIAALVSSQFPKIDALRVGEGAVIGFTELTWVLEMAVALGGLACGMRGIGIRKLEEVVKSSPAIKSGLVFLLAVCCVNALPLTAVAPNLSIKYWLHTSEFLQKADLSPEESGYSYRNESYDVSFYLGRAFKRVETAGCPESAFVVLQARNLEAYQKECSSVVEVLGTYTPLGESTGKSIVMARVVRSSPRINHVPSLQ